MNQKSRCNCNWKDGQTISFDENGNCIQCHGEITGFCPKEDVPPANWEKEWEKLKDQDGGDVSFHCINCEILVKSFIKSLLLSKETELIEKIEGMKKYIEEGFTGKYSRMDKGYKPIS